MSWAKASADSNLAGLSEWEVVRGVMQGEVDVTLPDVPEDKFINIVSTCTECNVNNVNVEDVEDTVCIYKVHSNLEARRRG